MRALPWGGITAMLPILRNNSRTRDFLPYQYQSGFQKLLYHGLPCVHQDRAFSPLVCPFIDSAKLLSTSTHIIFSSPTITASTGSELGNYKFKSFHGLPNFNSVDSAFFRLDFAAATSLAFWRRLLFKGA